MQIQADVLGRPVLRPAMTETTALGAAMLAGLGTGLWHDQADLAARWRLNRIFTPSLSEAARESGYAGWRRAVTRSRGWLDASE
jgi:glycerol kinase